MTSAARRLQKQTWRQTWRIRAAAARKHRAVAARSQRSNDDEHRDGNRFIGIGGVLINEEASLGASRGGLGAYITAATRVQT